MSTTRLITLSVLACAQASAAVALASPFTDHAVLQREQPVSVWGTEEPGQTVTVSLQGLKATAVASAEGKWKAVLPALPVGGPYELTVAGSSTIVLKDILVGEVWLCSGQSNMEWSVKKSDNGDAEIAKAAYPNIRLFNVTAKKKPSNTPVDKVDAVWTACTPETVANFSGVGYFFGRELAKELNVPIGLISSSWGGTAAQAWTSQPALEATAEFRPMLADWEKDLSVYPTKLEEYRTVTLTKWEKENAEAKAAGKPEIRKPQEPNGPNTLHRRPAGLYNGMIAPLAPYALRGAIWYQGESNTGNPEPYRRLMATMIADWRSAFGQEFSFYQVQLANYMKDDPTALAKPWPVVNWPILRESQAVVAATVSKAGMALAIDIGNPADIHPTNKQEVGRRLALNALAKDYDKAVEFAGPTFKAMSVSGRTAVISYDHADGLAAKDGDLKGFLIAGEDGLFVPATAKITTNKVVVSSPKVAVPAAVRYDWSNSPDGNLINKAGLPAAPFRFPMK
jgi:sialate O-acetylesterase